MEKKNTLYFNNQKLLVFFTCICWLSAKLISWKVWGKERLFPTLPVSDLLYIIPAWFHTLLFFVSIAMLVMIMFYPKKRTLLIILLISELAACLLDQNRWQPWEYQYIFTISVFIFCKDREQIKALLSFILIATYFFSGLHKLNNGFLYNMWDKMILSSFFNLNDQVIHHQPAIYYFGYLLGSVECISGFLLLFKRTRKVVVYVLIVMHLFILFILGPFGLNYNKVVLPWNMLMIGWLYVLYIREITIDMSFSFLWKGWGKMVILAWGIFPLLSFFGYWDNFLSGSIYSGNSPFLSICIKDDSKIPELQPYLERIDYNKICDGDRLLYVQNWGMQEMQIVSYPEMRAYKKFKEQWIKKYPLVNARFYLIYFTDSTNNKIELPSGK